MKHQHRVFAVDRSVLFRRILDNIFSGEDEIQLVGLTSTLETSLREIRQIRPDILVVSIVENEKTLAKMLVELRCAIPHLVIVGLCDSEPSPPRRSGSQASLDVDSYVVKPAKTGGLDACISQLRDDVLFAIQSRRADSCGRAAEPGREIGTQVASVPPNRSCCQPEPIGVVAIGASTGRLNELVRLLCLLPRRINATVLVAHTLPSCLVKILIRQVSQQCSYPLTLAYDGARPNRNSVWISPGACEFTIEGEVDDEHIRVAPWPTSDRYRTPVDSLTVSAAEVRGSRVLGILLNDGEDWRQGCQMIERSGGDILACGGAQFHGLGLSYTDVDMLAEELARRVACGPAAERDAKRPSVDPQEFVTS